MKGQINILIVEDLVADAELIERELRKANIPFNSRRVDTKEGFLAALLYFEPTIVLSDYNLPQFSGPEALTLLKEAGLSIPFILITGSLTEEVAVECMKQGAHDYILKSSLTRLPSAVLNGLEKAKTMEQLRLSEEQLRMSQKLEAVGQLAGGVAHDFNNLLTVITGYSDLVLTQLSESDDTRPKIVEIKRAAQRASSLTRQLLAFSRKQVLLPKFFNLNDLVGDMSKMLQRLIGEDIEMTTSLGPEAPIYADPGQIEQVLMNLVVNARDAMPDGGRLTIETSRVEIDEDYSSTHLNAEPGPYVMLAVSDTGGGMDPETLKHIFEPFFTTKEHGRGTGLGLSTVYGIVKQSGGSIWLYSELGQGTVFKIYLPIATAKDIELSTAPDPPAIPRGAETILIVEDEPQIRQLAFECLTHCGYKVLPSANGVEALQLVHSMQQPIHLVVSDVVMPKMSGRDLVQRISEVQPLVKVLFMSGYTNDAIVNHGILEGGTWFIQKPFAFEALARKVREVLDSEEPPPQAEVSKLPAYSSADSTDYADYTKQSA
ncbi:MAG TPA: response regulator [Pyrinomonadaceae bacterium]|jgi:two-component system, cell cycle sensor histidine kinase and response regulator CckA|nr:response regulator [Pyrinomonadaceae bacterium]